jgi:hypothetical protein
MIDGRGTRTARYWQTLVRHVHDDSLAHGEIIAQLLVRHRGAHQLAVGVLAVFSRTIQHNGPARGLPSRWCRRRQRNVQRSATLPRWASWAPSGAG